MSKLWKSFSPSEGFKMNIGKISIILYFLLIPFEYGFNIDLKLWNLNNHILKNSIEQILLGYIESEARLISIAVRLQYSHDWQIVINNYLLAFLKNGKSMTFQIFNNINGRTGQVYPYNIWYVDSFRAFR